MLSISWTQPAWLLAIAPLCLLAWWIARRSLAGWGGRGGGAGLWGRLGFGSTRRTVQLAIRCILITLVCIVLAEPHLRRQASEVAVIAVVDTSDSVPTSQRQLAEEFLAASMQSRPSRDRFGMVTVGRDALVQSLPRAGEPSLRAGYTGPGAESRLESGVELGRALIPGDTGGRLLLISDGNETSGSLAGAATRLLAAGVPIDVATVNYDRSSMVRLDDLLVPSWVRDGDTITARIALHAGGVTEGRLTLSLNGQPINLDPTTPDLSARVRLEPGRNILSQQLRLPPGPTHHLSAHFQPDDGDVAFPELLRAEAITFTSDRGRVLLLAEDAQAAAPLAAALSEDNINVSTLPAAAAPTSLAGWAGYDAVILFDQPADNFSQAQQSDLAQYVHDTGGGLLVIGGPRSFGAGGWIESPLADAVPVAMDPPQKRQLPMGALAIVLDRSGSMAATVSGTGMNQQQIAAEASILGVRALSRLDQVTVVAFSGGVELIVPLSERGDGEAIAQRIRAIGPGGGTNMFPGIDAAAAELEKSPAAVRHIVVLTDGATMGDPAYGVGRAAQLASRGISLSTIAIGDQANTELLRRLAAAGGGRAHTVASSDARAVLPQIFITEVQTVRRSLIWEGPPFTPQRAFVGETLRGFGDPLPGISGYVVTGDRGGLATVMLRGPEDDPILAQWQHGMGRAIAFTSDATTRWAPAWTSWHAFNAFWLQQVKWVMRPGSDPGARITLDEQGDQTRVRLELFDREGHRVNFASVHGRIAGPTTDQGGRDTRDVNFRQVGPGQYEATVDSSAAGAHVLSLNYEAPGATETQARRGSIRAAIIGREGDELRSPAPNIALLRSVAERTNGRMYELSAAGINMWTRDHLTMPHTMRPLWLLLATIAVALFLLDVASRRIAIDVPRALAGLLRLWNKPPEVAPASLAGLSAARQRARLATTQPAPDRRDPHIQRPSPVPTPTATTADPIAPETPRRPREPAPEAEGDDVMSRLRAAKRRSHNTDNPPE